MNSKLIEAQWGKQKHKTKTATMSEEDLVNSLAELSRERAPEAQKVLRRYKDFEKVPARFQNSKKFSLEQTF